MYTRLYDVLQMLSNLANGLAEDGSMLELNSESRQGNEKIVVVKFGVYHAKTS
jgi:hypothetical protein